MLIPPPCRFNRPPKRKARLQLLKGILESSQGNLSAADYTPSAPKGGRGKSKGKGGAQQWVPNEDGIDSAVGVDGGGDNGGGEEAAAAVSAAAPGAAAKAGVAQKGRSSRSTQVELLAGQPPRLPFPRAGHAAASCGSFEPLESLLEDTALLDPGLRVPARRGEGGNEGQRG